MILEADADHIIFIVLRHNAVFGLIYRIIGADFDYLKAVLILNLCVALYTASLMTSPVMPFRIKYRGSTRLRWIGRG